MFRQKNKSCVCIISKNEGIYLTELVAYYAALGFDQIIVYDNGSTDHSGELLRVLKKQFKIKVLPWEVRIDESPQIEAYRHAIKHCKQEWLMFVDADEFLVLHKHVDINEFLQAFDSRPDVSLIGVNWRIFGDAHAQTNDGRPVIERLTKASAPDFVVNGHIKSLFRVKKQSGLVHMHACETTGRMVQANGADLNMTSEWGIVQDIDYSVAQVNHYYGKTREEFELKIQRGQAGVAETDDMKYCYNQQYFIVHNRNECEDLSAQRLLPHVKAAISELRS